jgi:general secretion pathway protein D
MTLQTVRNRVSPLLCALALLAGLWPAGAHAQDDDEPPPSTLMKAPFVPKIPTGGKPDPAAFKQGFLPKGRPGVVGAGPDTKADGASPVGGGKRLPPPGAPRPGARSDDDTTGAPGTGGGAALKWQQPGDQANGGDTPRLGSDFIKNCVRLRPNVRVHLDIYDEELESVVKLIACMTGKNIILPKSLKGAKITIYSPSPVNSEEAYRAFLSALEANGKTLSEKGKFFQIIEIKDFVKSPDALRPTGSTPPNEDRMVTQIVPLKHVDAQEINEVLSKLASPNASFIVYAPSNAIIVTETGSNLRKLLDLLEQLDVPGGKEQLWVYQVLHAEAGEISSKITEIFGSKDGSKGKKAGAPAPAPAAGKKDAKAGGGAASTSSVGDSDQAVQVGKVIADERTNRLLIVATARSYRQIKDLIAKLDVPIEGDGQVHIHKLNHAKAEDLANVLSNLSQNAKNRAAGGRAKAKTGKDAGAAAAGGAAGAGGAALFEGEVQISADESTNALVITASFKDFVSMKRVIEQLDQPRRQVFLEAIIMEVSVGSNRTVDVSLHNANGIPLASKPGDISSLGLTSAAGTTALLSNSGLAVLAATGNTRVYGVDIPSFGAVLSALATSNNANILSTPSLLTTDNAEAEIVVGNNVPFPASGGLGGGGGVGAAAALAAAAGGANGANVNQFAGLFGQQIQRQDVALTLKITPRVNASNFVTLEVDQVVEDIENPDTGGLGPTTAKRSIKTTVVVKDQQTVVIGGLQKNKESDGQAKVPILGEIPVIGFFFRKSATSQERRNLVLMITPHVIEGPEDFQAIFKRKIEEHREFEARFRREGDGFVVGIDYGKKHGALEAMRQSLRAAQREQDEIDEVRRQQEGPPLPQDQDGVPLESDEGPIEVPSGSDGDHNGSSGGSHDSQTFEPEPIDPPPAPEVDSTDDSSGDAP